MFFPLASSQPSRSSSFKVIIFPLALSKWPWQSKSGEAMVRRNGVPRREPAGPAPASMAGVMSQSTVSEEKDSAALQRTQGEEKPQHNQPQCPKSLQFHVVPGLSHQQLQSRLQGARRRSRKYAKRRTGVVPGPLRSDRR